MESDVEAAVPSTSREPAEEVEDLDNGADRRRGGGGGGRAHEQDRCQPQGPLTRPFGPTSPPKGEVSLRDMGAPHLSLGGEVDGKAGG